MRSTSLASGVMRQQRRERFVRKHRTRCARAQWSRVAVCSQTVETISRRLDMKLWSQGSLSRSPQLISKQACDSSTRSQSHSWPALLLCSSCRSPWMDPWVGAWDGSQPAKRHRSTDTPLAKKALKLDPWASLSTPQDARKPACSLSDVIATTLPTLTPEKTGKRACQGYDRRKVHDRWIGGGRCSCKDGDSEVVSRQFPRQEATIKHDVVSVRPQSRGPG